MEKKKSVKWTIFFIVIVIAGVVSLWTILSRQANQNRSYSGAKYIECPAGGTIDGQS
ncbi:MAG TPA: hypothetical protein GX505_06670 [Clostridiales bacterium]|nr:hypothetical protein [Clostridiales bacterium]